MKVFAAKKTEKGAHATPGPLRKPQGAQSLEDEAPMYDREDQVQSLHKSMVIVKSKSTLMEDELNELDCAPIEEERVDPLEEEKNNNVLKINRTYSK